MNGKMRKRERPARSIPRTLPNPLCMICIIDSGLHLRGHRPLIPGRERRCPHRCPLYQIRLKIGTPCQDDSSRAVSIIPYPANGKAGCLGTSARWSSPNTVHLRVEDALRPQQSPNRLSENSKNILLSPSGGGEDEGEGVKCGAHPPHPYSKKGGCRTA
jgi:hypothetical protein